MNKAHHPEGFREKLFDIPFVAFRSHLELH